MTHRIFIRRLALIVALTAALVVALAATTEAAQRPACYEDEPCWTWSTMGNQQRGVTLKSGRRVVVGVCRFARLDARRRIDWRSTPRLRGDHTARIHQGCTSAR